MSVLFIGLGNMGFPMARNLARTQEIYVNDVDAGVAERFASEVGAQAVDISAVPPDVELVVIMVPNSRIVEALVESKGGLLEQLAAGSLIVDMSSSEPASTQRLSGLAAQRDIDYLDAPVSGGVAKAISGELAIMVGGQEHAFTRALRTLSSMGTAIHHVGSSGAGDAAKALNNLLSATNIAAAAEVLSAAARFGIRPESMLEVINSSTGRSQASEVKFPAQVLTGAFASGFGFDLMLKDLAIARSITAGVGLQTPVTEAAYSSAVSARALAGDPADHLEIVRFYEDTNKTTLRSTQTPKES